MELILSEIEEKSTLKDKTLNEDSGESSGNSEPKIISDRSPQLVQIVEEPIIFLGYEVPANRFWGSLQVLGFLIAAYALFLSIEASRLAQYSARETAIVSAWQLLSTPTPGSSGKRDSMELLMAAGASFEGIDLSCETMGGHWVEEDFSCELPVNLWGLRNADREGNINPEAAENPAYLFKAKLSGIKLSQANLEGASMWSTDLRGSTLLFVDFSDADLSFANLSKSDASYAKFANANLTGVNFSNASLNQSDLTSAILAETNFTNANLTDSNLSNARFCDEFEVNECVLGLTQKQINSAWVWVDQIPLVFRKTGKWRGLMQPPACSISLRAEYVISDYSGKPFECGNQN